MIGIARCACVRVLVCESVRVSAFVLDSSSHSNNGKLQRQDKWHVCEEEEGCVLGWSSH